jgi:hypothetical protein
MLPYDEFMGKARADADRTGQGMSYSLDSSVPSEDRFLAAWRTGGADGGSCWSETTREIEAEPEPQLMELLEFLDDLGLRLRHVNEVLGVAVTGSHAEDAHYGNVTYWRYKYVTLEALHAKLAELGYVEPAPGEPGP